MALEQRASSNEQREDSRPKAGRSFQDLEAWKACRNVRMRAAALAKKLPTSEKFRLADQIIRATRSATSNLAEGYGRFQYRDMVHFARQARGSLYEVLDHLTVALDEGYVSKPRYEQEVAEVQKAIQLVNGYIRYLRQRQEAGGQ